MTNPKISIVMPTYNRADLISETLESIIAQTFDSWECIIVDDNSNDNTLEIVTPFLMDKRFKFTTKPIGDGSGLGLSVVHGIVKSHKGDIVTFDNQPKGTVFQIRLPLTMN